MDREAWRAATHGVAESDMTEQLNWTEPSFLYPVNIFSHHLDPLSVGQHPLASCQDTENTSFQTFICMWLFSVCHVFSLISHTPLIWTAETCQICGDFSLVRDVSLSEVWIIVVISVLAKRDRHFKGSRRKGYGLEVSEPHSWWFHMLVGWGLPLPLNPREFPCMGGSSLLRLWVLGALGLSSPPYRLFLSF